MASSVEEVRKSIRGYLMVFGALGVLTAVTVMASWLPVSVAVGVFIALAIASVKGTLVATCFMHLLGERSTLYWVLMIAFFFFLLLLLIPVLMHSETVHLIDQVN